MQPSPFQNSSKRLALALSILRLGLLLSAGDSLASTAPHCPATDATQPGYYCPPIKPEMPNQGQPGDDLLACLTSVEVRYYNNLGQLKKGTLIVNRDLVADAKTSIVTIFEEIRAYNRARITVGTSFFPITSVLPVNNFG